MRCMLEDEDTLSIEMPISTEWRKSVNEALSDRGWFQKDLAEAVGTTAATVSNILKSSKSSELVGAISRILRIPVPFVSVLDERELLWISAGKRLRKNSPLEFDKQLARITRLISK